MVPSNERAHRKSVHVDLESVMDLGYDYSRLSLKKTPDNAITIVGLLWLSTWNISNIFCNISLQGIYLYLCRINHDMEFFVTTDQVVQTIFDTSAQYRLWN